MKNKIEFIHGDCLEKMKDIPDKCIDLVLVDPPYINMISEPWDRFSDENAKIFFNSLKKELYRVLRFGGRFICFSSNDTLQYLYDNVFLHRELLVVNKDVKKVAAGRNTKQYRQHINAVEYIFVATKFAREHIRSLLLNVKGNLTAKEINSKLGLASNGGGMWSIYTGNNKCKQVPTKKQWQKFREIFKELPEYESFEEVFHNSLSKGNVLSGFNFNIKNRVHPTQKPLSLIEYLIETYSNYDDLILDCCAGSGTTGVACKNLNRNFIGIELNEEYFEIAKNRINEQQFTLNWKI
jgi:DNA modification methylase